MNEHVTTKIYSVVHLGAKEMYKNSDRTDLLNDQLNLFQLVLFEAIK